MPHAAESPRSFSVYVHDGGDPCTRIVEEASFEAAAVAYLEDFHPPLGEAYEVSVIVRDLSNGHEHCYRVDLGSGEAEPCS